MDLDVEAALLKHRSHQLGARLKADSLGGYARLGAQRPEFIQVLRDPRSDGRIQLFVVGHATSPIAGRAGECQIASQAF